MQIQNTASWTCLQRVQYRAYDSFKYCMWTFPVYRVSPLEVIMETEVATTSGVATDRYLFYARNREHELTKN
jgi:hypothetical protein